MVLEHLNEFFRSLWAKVSQRKQHPKTVLPQRTSSLEQWDLDPEFFAALTRWTLTHPESSLDRVMEKICFGLDCGKELFELIPDRPFPARGLIKGLAQVVKLGTVRDSDPFKNGINSIPRLRIDNTQGPERCSGICEANCSLGGPGEVRI